MPKKKIQDDEPKKTTLYTIKLTDEQMDKVKAWCDKRLWNFYEVDYARFGFKGDGVNLVGYNSGKLVVQGKKTEDWVTYVLEAEITHDPQLGYDEVLNPEWFETHAGVDESGKGDFFGPLVSACVIADKPMIEKWREGGLQDSKRITSDAAIMRLESMIRKTKGVVIETTWAKMGRYNELYKKFGSNLNKLLAWMHARSIEGALEKRHVPWGLLDQFTKQPLVQKQLKVEDFELRMRTKAESDPVVAAASVIARAEFVRQMNKLSEESGMELKKGASAQVKAQGKELVKKLGPDALGDYAKLHFRTAFEVLDLPVPEKKPWRKY